MSDGGTIWMDEPEEHDYPAAKDFLTLLFGDETAEVLVAALRTAPTIRRKAKDLLRASRLSVLEETNAHVASDLAKLRKGKALSPVLLVRGDGATDAPLIVADGYHRICASWRVDDDVLIPCRLVDRP